jgi:hypothetical protein
VFPGAKLFLAAPPNLLQAAPIFAYQDPVRFSPNTPRVTSKPQNRADPPWLLGVLFAVGFVATLPYWSLYFGMDDEAVTVLGANRLLAGEWPYYDWDSRHTPGSYLLSAPYLALLGSDRLAVRSLMALVAALSGIVIYKIGSATLPGRLRFLPWLMWTCSGLVAFPILNYHWFATLWTLIGIFACVRWQQGSARAAPALGCSAALALWTLQSDGLAVTLMGALTWLRFRPVGLARCVAAAVVASLILWLPFTPVLGEVIRQNVSDLYQHLPYNRYAYRWQPWLDLGRMLWFAPPPAWPDRLGAVSHFYLQTITYGMYYIILVAGLGLLEWRRRRDLLPLAWCMLAWALAGGNRQTVAYVSFSAPGIFLLLSALVSLLPRAATVGLGLAILEVLGWGVRWMQLRHSWTYPIVTRAGIYYTNDPQQAEAFGLVRTWSDQFLPPGTTVLAYPYLPSLYTTEKLKNPLRPPVLTPLLYSRREVESAVERLKAVDWIVYVELSPAEMQSSYGIPADFYRKIAAEELAILSRGFQTFRGGGSLRLLRRTQ